MSQSIQNKLLARVVSLESMHVTPNEQGEANMLVNASQSFTSGFSSPNSSFSSSNSYSGSFITGRQLPSITRKLLRCNMLRASSDDVVTRAIDRSYPTMQSKQG
jgi:hypothetical protein